jgi:RNA polymerase sigma factor (sigma-70 family)
MYICGNAADADDMVQEAFVQVLKALHRYRPEARFSTWLYTIATNAWRDELRRRAREASVRREKYLSRMPRLPAPTTAWTEPSSCKLWLDLSLNTVQLRCSDSTWTGTMLR